MFNSNKGTQSLYPDIYERYSRHIIIDEINIKGQKRIRESKILVVGAGGLSSPALLYLTTSGVGTLGIIDNDIVELSNLQRQIIYNINDLQQNKTLCALKLLKSINPLINIITYSSELTKQNIEEIFYFYDIIIDGTDNFASRNLISCSCYLMHKVHIYGAIERFNGHVSVFNYQNGPNYFETLSAISSVGLRDCNRIGVLNTLAGITGIIQATEAIKIITGIGSILNGYLLNIDALNLSFKKIKINKIKQSIIKSTKLKNSNNKIKYISINEIKKLGTKRKIFIDVRNNPEFQINKITEAINIPLQSFKKNIIIEFIKHKLSSNMVIVYCNNEMQSYLASQILHGQDINNYVLRGGINELLNKKEREGFEPSLSIT